MKLIIHQDRQIPETEITIRCARMDPRLEQLAEHIRQFGFSLTGYQEDREFQLPLEQIYLWTPQMEKPFFIWKKRCTAAGRPWHH